jgi:hypothetical protein
LTAEQREEVNARRRAARRSKTLTAEQKKEINASRSIARQNKSLEERNTQQRGNRQNIAPVKRQEMNAKRRARRHSIPEHERQALLAKRKANAAARRNTPCADSIALPCPIVASLATLKLAKEGATSPPVSPSRSTPNYIIGTEGDYSIFYSASYVKTHQTITYGLYIGHYR